MTRATNNPASRKRRKKVLKRAKGFRGGRSKLFRTANETVIRAMAFSTIHRKLKKRTMRKLWIVRLNAACREHNISYSKLIDGLKKAKVMINRKMLSELANRDAETFKKIVEVAQKNAA
ncbi:MAG: 50S ribosomal protein L20 [Candidatus Omnitrophica bacterium]|nr:50S ribosomal protein L20 [Candidatus Omnitrophota bacterium]